MQTHVSSSWVNINNIMKTILKLLLSISLFFSGCATTAVQHTIYQRQIEQKEDKLTDDAKDFLVKATQMLRVDSGTVDIKRVQMLLEKSQSLLGVDIDDGKELKNLNGSELDKAVDKVIEEAEKEKDSIEDLKKKLDDKYHYVNQRLIEGRNPYLTQCSSFLAQII